MPFLRSLATFIPVVFISTNAFALNLQLLGNVGYERTTMGDNDFDGFTLGAQGASTLVPLAGSAGILANSGFNFSRVTNKTNNIDFVLSEFTFRIGTGIEVAPFSKFRLQSTINYDFGIWGETKITTGSQTITNSTSKYGRVSSDWKGLFKVYPAIEIGFGVNFFYGSFDNANGNGNESRFSGNDYLAIFAYTF